MSDPTRDLSVLLEREREAVLQADLDALTELQDRKREVLDRALEAGVAESAAFKQLALVARSNIVLIRQLVTLHRALAGFEPARYGADGREAHGAAPSLARAVL